MDTILSKLQYLLRKTCANCYWFHRHGCLTELLFTKYYRYRRRHEVEDIQEKFWKNPEDNVCDAWKYRYPDRLEEFVRAIMEKEDDTS